MRKKTGLFFQNTLCVLTIAAITAGGMNTAVYAKEADESVNTDESTNADESSNAGQNEETCETAKEEGEAGEPLEEQPAEPIVYEDVTIKNVDDFLKFAESCKIDAWSLNKNVKLEEDINLRDTDFETVPYFNGIFDGNSHTIKGYELQEGGYITGVFRYVGPCGMIENLNVQGDIDMADEQRVTGGLCGVNCGVISGCSFKGLMSGNNTVGCIAAINENTGLITKCVNSAHVSGYNFTGGITGKNYGVISGCTNNGDINDNEEWVIKDDEKGDSIIESISAAQNKEDIKDVVISGIDTGGITGYSTGSIIRCTNNGNIGYDHVGYNVGGIAGRQMGIISYSTNKGNIYGRKDIGGIVGQMEPYLEKDDMQTLPEAADKLHDLIEKTINDMDGSVDTISSDITSLTGYADGVVDDGRVLTGELTDSVNQNAEVINAVIERFEYVIDNLPGIVDNVSTAADSLGYFGKSLARIVEDVNYNSNVTDSDRESISRSKDNIYKTYSDTEETARRVTELTERINDLMYETDAEGNKKFRDLTEEEEQELNGYLAELQQISGQSGSDISGMMGDFSNIVETYKPYVETGTDEAIGEIDNAVAALQDAQGDLRKASQGARSIIDYLNSQSELRFHGLTSTWDNSLDSLHSNLKGITGSLESINTDGKNSSHTLNDDIAAVNDQVNVIYHIVSDKFDILQNDDAEMFVDVSDEELEAAKTGRVDSSKNTGTIKGDIDIGGIAGSMAIDEEDPEENAAGNVNIGAGSKYTLKNIIYECKNDAFVQSKKDGSGLIVGYMAQGVVSGCEGYGLAKSSEGSYTGGIAGESLSIIRDSYSICLLDGNKYVGGITGYGTTISGCTALVTWEKVPAERYGAIAGIVNTDTDTHEMKMENIKNNVFVEDQIQGIDDISYENIAEEITYNKLINTYGIPSEYSHLKVTYMVDDEKIGEQELSYGESLSRLKYPDGEYRDGFYIKWPDKSDEIMEGNYVISGEYIATKKAIESTNRYTDTEKPLVLLGGSFGTDAKVDARIVEDEEKDQSDRLVPNDKIIYEIKIDEGTTSQSEDKRIRIYNPYSKRAKVMKLEDGKWIGIDSKNVGSYIEIGITDNEATYAIEDNISRIYTIIKAALAAVVLVLLIVLVIILRKIIVRRKNSVKKEGGKKVKNKKSRKTEEKKEDNKEDNKDNKDNKESTKETDKIE